MDSVDSCEAVDYSMKKSEACSVEDDHALLPVEAYVKVELQDDDDDEEEVTSEYDVDNRTGNTTSEGSYGIVEKVEVDETQFSTESSTATGKIKDDATSSCSSEEVSQQSDENIIAK